MAVTLGSTGVTFNDSTSQTTGMSTSQGSGDLIEIKSYNSSTTWYNPGASTVHVKLIGGGGGGAGYCEGGGAGGYAEGIYDVSSVQSVVVTVGGGGSYTTYYNAAGDGGTSSFGSYLSASGGYGANRNYSHSGGAGGNSFGGSAFAVQGGAGCGHINTAGHGALSSIGGGGYFGGAQSHVRNHTNLGNVPQHGTTGYGPPGSGGPGNITDWNFNWYRGHSAGEYGQPGIVIIYAYR